MDKPFQIFFFDSLEDDDTDVRIRGAINPKVSLKEIEARLSYGDLVLIVAMLRDYVKGLDEAKQEDVLWQSYYRQKFLSMAEKISGQIGYDYDKALAKCLKKIEKESDIGEDALILSLKYGKKPKKEETK